MNKLGKMVSDFRNVHQITQEEFARLSDVTVGVISKIECGQMQTDKTTGTMKRHFGIPRFNTLVKICKVLGVEPSEIMADQEKPDDEIDDPLSEYQDLGIVFSSKSPFSTEQKLKILEFAQYVQSSTGAR